MMMSAEELAAKIIRKNRKKHRKYPHSRILSFLMAVLPEAIVPEMKIDVIMHTQIMSHKNILKYLYKYLLLLKIFNS